MEPLHELTVYEIELEMQNEELRHSQVELEDSRDRYREFYDLVPVGHFTLTPSGSVVRVNPAGAGMLGVDRHELLFRSFASFVAHPHRDAWASSLAAARGGQAEVSKSRLRLLRSGGTSFPVEIRTSARETKAPPGTVSLELFVTDLTEESPEGEVPRFSPGHVEELRVLDHLAANSRDIILILRRSDGRVLEANAAAVRSYGYSRDELLGMTVQELRAPETRDRSAEQMGAADERGILFETVHRRRDGSTFPVEVSSQGSTVDGARTLISVVRDITERKRAEEALRASEERFSMAFRVNTSAMAITRRRDGLLLEVNDSYLQVTGYTRAELRGRTTAELRIWKDPADRDRLLQGLDEHGQVQNLDAHFIGPGGRAWTGLVSSHLAELDGEPVLISSILDVTEQRRAAQALQASEERLRRLVEQVSDGIFAASSDGRYTDVNAAGCQMLGMTRDEVLACTFLDLLAPEEHERLPDAIASFADGEVHRSEWRFRRKDGSVFIGELDGRRFPDGTFQGALRDITERKQAHEAALDADRRKTAFLATLSHELRNPLAPMTNALHILDQAKATGEQALRAKVVLGRQVAQLARLVDDLLDVTRISHGKIHLQRGPADLQELLRHAVEDNQATFTARGVELTLRPAPPLCVEADPARISQAVGNLLQNAAKFTSAGGHVTVAVERQDGSAVVRVKDDGLGIEPEVLRHLFEPFRQADRTLHRSQGGLGLGLALVKGLVELHGGDVEGRSDGLGHGAEFVIRLPLPAATTVGLPPRPAGRQRPARSHVLVVDDNQDGADSLKELLELEGHSVEVAYDGRAGIEKARAIRPEIIICDIGLPGLNGFEVARQIRADLGSSPTLVALTGYAQADDQCRAFDAGFDHHLSKPMDLQKIRALLGRHRNGAHDTDAGA